MIENTLMIMRLNLIKKFLVILEKIENFYVNITIDGQEYMQSGMKNFHS